MFVAATGIGSNEETAKVALYNPRYPPDPKYPSPMLIFDFGLITLCTVHTDFNYSPIQRAPIRCGRYKIVNRITVPTNFIESRIYTRSNSDNIDISSLLALLGFCVKI